MLKIQSNGSKWAGDAPDSIETLLEVLSREPLDPRFEKYGNFFADVELRIGIHVGRGKYVDGDLIYPEYPNARRFFGNFANLSHVFTIDTDEPEVISKLVAAIRANQARPDYKAIKAKDKARKAA